MKKVVDYGTVKEVKSLETKDGKNYTVIKYDVEGKWDAETKSRPVTELAVYYFNDDEHGIKRAEWSKTAGEKYIGKTVMFSYVEVNGRLRGEDTPGILKLITIPPKKREFETEEELNAAYDKFDGALCAVLEKNLLPEDFVCDMENVEDLKKTAELLGSLERCPEVSECQKALRGLLASERNYYIGTVAGVIKDDTKGTFKVSIALPGKKGEEAKWASVTFYRENAGRAEKVLKPKSRVMLYMGEGREFNGRMYYSGLGFQRLDKPASKDETK